jgi:hypothetical protein
MGSIEAIHWSREVILEFGHKFEANLILKGTIKNLSAIEAFPVSRIAFMNLAETAWQGFKFWRA